MVDLALFIVSTVIVVMAGLALISLALGLFGVAAASAVAALAFVVDGLRATAGAVDRYFARH